MKNVWDKIFNDEKFCTDLNPRTFVVESIISVLPSAGPILDIGCGCGRHLVYLAANGYKVCGIDLSDVALRKAKENLQNFGLTAALEKNTMWEIPFDNVRFAGALAINVLNHGLPDEISKTITAVSQRLLPGGLFLVTLLTTNDYRASGRQVDSHTFICDKGPEKGILHTVFDEQSARAMLGSNFAIESIAVSAGTIGLSEGEQVK
jgi:2-polyprenyl-3-methyl-5-hydroxy-6-metoxy-1,4-benzoquinol methylase